MYSKIPILTPSFGTFEQSQRWSLIRCTLGVENEGKGYLKFANKVFNRQDVLIVGGLNSGISLYTYVASSKPLHLSHASIHS